MTVGKVKKCRVLAVLDECRALVSGHMEQVCGRSGKARDGSEPERPERKVVVGGVVIDWWGA